MESENLEEAAASAGEDETAEVENHREQDEAEVEEEVKEKKKRGGKKSEAKKKKKDEEDLESPEKMGRKRKSSVGQATPLERPSRERRTVERYMAMSPQKPTVSKAVPIKQGSGTKLREIPNVHFKLSKRKVDENLHHLHRILFGKKAKVHYVKRNIFEFSGFVWTDSEEKERAKLREKLDKCVKDRLLDFCDVLDIRVCKATTKKEDVCALMLDFLQCPHVTRDVVLKDKEQGKKKRKRKAKRGMESTLVEKKRKKQSTKIKDENNKNEEDVERDEADDDSSDDKDTPSDDASGPSDHERNETDKDDTEVEFEAVKISPHNKQTKGSAPVEEKKTPKKEISESKDDTSKKNRKSSKTDHDKASTVERVAAKNINVDPVSPSGSKRRTARSKNPKEDSSQKKPNKKEGQDIKQKSRVSGKGKIIKKDHESPTKEEMHAVLSDILKEVDFNTATLADILKQLGAHFGIDLIHRKAEVKSIIEDVINSMTDEESDEEEGGVEVASEKEDDASEPLGNTNDSKEKPEKEVDNKEISGKDNENA